MAIETDITGTSFFLQLHGSFRLDFPIDVAIGPVLE